MDNSWIGLVIFIATYIAGRLISERALKLLSENEQGKLLKGFSRYRVFSMIGVVVIVILHYAAISQMPNSYLASMEIFVGVLVAYLLLSTIYAYSKLRSLELPDKYINQFLLSTLIQYIGLFIFFGYIVLRPK